MLFGLIAVASVATLNLAMANVALPDIGKAFQASQTGLNLVSLGVSLGLAGRLAGAGWHRALPRRHHDRYGPKMHWGLGMLRSVPRKEQEHQLLESHERQDAVATS